MKRRQFLYGAGILACGALGISTYRYWPEQGLLNPCEPALPEALSNHHILRSIWQELNPALVWDSHAHLVGTGDSGQGIWLNPNMSSPWHPVQYAQRFFFLDAGCVRHSKQVDYAYIEHLSGVVAQMPRGCKLVLLAFDHYYDERGKRDLERTGFYVPNSYTMQTAKRFPSYFEWAASIHPYRKDCISALDEAAKMGARAVKWLPAAMGINPASPLCDGFYGALAKYDIPLITHAGEERAVEGGNMQNYGNPLLLRRALDHGVRVVVAHCASMGQDRDLDKGENGPLIDSFQLFSRMMDNHRYEGRLFGDISAITQINRLAYIKPILERAEWHGRLLNGSDYPLPGVMPLFSVGRMVDMKLLDQDAAPLLKQLRRYNPLLFDFATKRLLHSRGKRFATEIFQTRRFFERKDS